MGFTADIIVWDLEARRPIHKLSLHKVKVTALDFSFDDRFLASLGGEDDNSLVIWDVQSGKAICGSPTDKDHTLQVKFLNRSTSKLVTGGKYKGKSGTVVQIVPGNPELGTKDLTVVKLDGGSAEFPVISIDDLLLVK